MAHHLAGLPWPGDEDIIVRGVRIGTLKLGTPRLPRNRVDKRMVVKLLRKAAADQKWWWCLILVLAYNFMLRMPPELFAQFARPLLRMEGTRFTYGPIRRKQRVNWCSITAFCTCSTCEELCLHKWLPVLDSPRCCGGRRLGGYRPATWTAEMRSMLIDMGITDAQRWFGHDVRRGAAADVFAASGVDAMLQQGGWRSLGGARPYVGRDEVSAGYLAQACIDDSDPES